MLILISLALAAAGSGAPEAPMTEAQKADVKAAAQSWGGCIAGNSAGRTSFGEVLIDELLKTCAGSEAALEAALARALGPDQAKGQMTKAREAVRASLLKAAPSSK